MNNREVSIEEIRDIAFRTTGQSHNSEWKPHRYRKLASSKVGRAISVIRNLQSTKIQHLPEEIYAPMNLDPVPAIKRGVDHELVPLTRIRTRPEVV